MSKSFSETIAATCKQLIEPESAQYATVAHFEGPQPAVARKSGVSSTGSPSDSWIMSLDQLVVDHPVQSTPVVDGLVRRGETMNIIAAPKVGKTWLAHGLARAVSLGEPWLGFPTIQGRVLIIDAELHPSELAQRLRAVVPEYATVAQNPIDVVSLRGRMMDVYELADRLRIDVAFGQYSLIALDALYRFLPRGCSENDNAAMMAVYNVLDGIARQTGAAVAVVHHSSKGDQSGKTITDMGSGAGSIARATDTHLAIRPHEQEGLGVLQAVCRSFPQPDDISIRWAFPYWERSSMAPVIATRQSGRDERQKQFDKEADQAVQSALKGPPLSISQIRTSTGMGQQRVERALQRLGAVGKRSLNKRTGKKTYRFRLPNEAEVV